MITVVVGCILAGCLQDVPVIIGKDPIIYHLTNTKPKPIDKSKFSCYVNGEFFTSCPQ